MATEAKNPRTAYAIFGTDFYGKRHHLGDAVARTAYDAWLGAQQEHGERWHDLTAVLRRPRLTQTPTARPVGSPRRADRRWPVLAACVCSHFVRRGQQKKE